MVKLSNLGAGHTLYKKPRTLVQRMTETLHNKYRQRTGNAQATHRQRTGNAQATHGFEPRTSQTPVPSPYQLRRARRTPSSSPSLSSPSTSVSVAPFAASPLSLPKVTALTCVVPRSFVQFKPRQMAERWSAAAAANQALLSPNSL